MDENDEDDARGFCLIVTMLRPRDFVLDHNLSMSATYMRRSRQLDVEGCPSVNLLVWGGGTGGGQPCEPISFLASAGCVPVT